MKHIKKILCGLFSIVLSFSCLVKTPVNYKITANTNDDVILEVGETYTYTSTLGSFDITDEADGVTVDCNETLGLNISLFNHVSNTANSLNSFSTTANTSIALKDALFTITGVEGKTDIYTIKNEKTNTFLTNDSSAGTFFSSDSKNMKIVAGTEVEDTFVICKENNLRFIIFFNNNMDFNSNSTFTANYGTGSYHLLLLKGKDTYSHNDIIPGYEQVTSIESGESYLIAYKNDLGVFVLYPTNGTDKQTKLVKFNPYNELYAIGSTSVSSDALSQFHLTISNEDSGITMQATNGKYMSIPGGGNVILNNNPTYFTFENGLKAGTFRIKTIGGSSNLGRFYVFNNSGTKLDAMGSYLDSWDGSSGSYDLMLFEQKETLSVDDLICGYSQVTDITTLDNDKSYLIAYEKESGSGKGIYVVSPFGSVSNANSVRTVSKKLLFTALDYGKDTVTINGNEYNFHVVKNLAYQKNIDVFWSNGSAQSGVKGPTNATDGIINTDNYLEFGADNNTNGSYLQIDLGKTELIKKIRLYRYWKDGRTYRNTVIAVSNDENFYNYKVIYNTDTNNVHGLGAGTDATYGESSAGKAFVFEDTMARYVRIYNNGQNDSKTTNHVVEVQVYGYEETPTEITTPTVMNTKNNVYAGNYLFEGYYSDTEGNSVVTRSDFVANEAYFAKYVDPKVLSVKAQSELVNGNVNVRFVSSVASANLDQVRFKIEVIDGENIKTGKITTKKVYEEIAVNDGGKVIFTDPKTVFKNEASKYFFVGKLNNIPESAKLQSVRVTPYWLPHGYADEDKNYVKGITRTFTVQEFFDEA